MLKVMVTNYHLSTSYHDYIERFSNKIADYIILREKWADDEWIVNLLSSLPNDFDYNKLIVNHHHQTAIECNIYKLHFSFEDYISKYKWIKRMKKTTPQLKCGVSIHNLEQYKQLDLNCIDYVLVGTLFATDCKPDIDPLGLNNLDIMLQSISLPVVVIGGITDDSKHCLENRKISGYAQMSAYYTD